MVQCLLFTELEIQDCPVARVTKPAPKSLPGTQSVGSEGQRSSRALTQGQLEAVWFPVAPASMVKGHFLGEAEDGMGLKQAEGEGVAFPYGGWSTWFLVWRTRARTGSQGPRGAAGGWR